MDLHEYDARICVAGSRSFHDSIKFDAILRDYLSWISVKNIAFISGGARRGADAMIIEWAKKHGYPCFVFLADWDANGKAAGHMRNALMRENLTHLLAFWDGESKGTEEMVDKTMDIVERQRDVALIMVKPDSGWNAYKARAGQFKKQKDKHKGFNRGWKSKGR